MIELKQNELTYIVGGAISAAMIAAVVSGVKLIIELGRAVGTAVRMIISKNMCSV